jgi:hypothetical protein
MKTKLKLRLLLLALLSLSGFVHAQGTAISYQGRLNHAGAPATGLHDFTFNVFDVEAGGTALATTVVLAAVPVTNGLFNVSLDFGTDIFTGAKRWLEIGVRTNGSLATYSILSPRQGLTPSPYAIFATKSGTASNVVNGSVVKSFNGLKDSVTLAAGANVTITPSGNTLTIASAGAGGSSIWSVNGNQAYYNVGNVGIGTASPLASLDVLGNWNGEQGALNLFGDRPSVRFTGDAGSDNRSWLMHLGGSPGDLLFYRRAGAGAWIPTLSLGAASGNVGMGTTTPASKLTVFTPSGGITRVGIEHTDGTIRLGTYAASGLGGSLGTVSDHPLSFFYNNNYAAPSMTIGGGGISMVSGLGTLTVGSPNAESGLSIIRGGNRADVRFEGATLKLVVGPVGGPPASANGVAISTSGNVGIGTTDPQVKLDVRGTTRTCVLTITGGCDLAEPFPLKDENIPKGSVVVIDDEHPGRLMRSERAYDSRVAGIISGANGINPGITLQQEGAFVDGQNVALSGRVYVHADAAFGAIKPGDLLTTSDTPGHAMKVTEHPKAQGAILGKAMSELKAGKGMVLVLVTLQ